MNLTSVEGKRYLFCSVARHNSIPSIRWQHRRQRGHASQTMTYDTAAIDRQRLPPKRAIPLPAGILRSDGGGTAYTDGQTVNESDSKKKGQSLLFAQWRANKQLHHSVQCGNTADGGSTEPEHDLKPGSQPDSQRLHAKQATPLWAGIPSRTAAEPPMPNGESVKIDGH